MPFHRFEDLESHYLTPHLSTGKAPVIEGRYIYFCLLHKVAGTGSELHYHPNELLIFPVRGKINAIVGKDRRIVKPGTFVHAPAYARHSMKATEDGNLQYLYIKDKTWTVVGLAEDEAVPDKAMTVAEVNQKYNVGDRDKHQKTQGKSQAIIEGLPVCFHPILDSLDAPPRSGRCVNWIEGERLAFGLFEVPAGYAEPEAVSERELFVYVLSGKIDAQTGGARKTIGHGDILYVPRGERYRLQVREHARYATVCSTPWLENRIDNMSPAEAEQARVNMKPN
ncbi:MAG: cupin domain-containing protein [Burkholderiales bacterium]|nr:cupin domain-containing protein [Burkholderiales bacterium]MDP2398076.1 cupin domain-containing protein [Burkholderiales bacterium]